VSDARTVYIVSVLTQVGNRRIFECTIIARTLHGRSSLSTLPVTSNPNFRRRGWPPMCCSNWKRAGSLLRIRVRVLVFEQQVSLYKRYLRRSMRSEGFVLVQTVHTRVTEYVPVTTRTT
jgi:hypothetical protein